MSTITPAVGSADVDAVVGNPTGNATAQPGATPRSGTVKWFDSKKGFGFILNPAGHDVFVHFSSIEGDGFRVLKDGEQVSYEELVGAKGLSARHVRRAVGETMNDER